jgi:DNA gyrase subunit A
LAEIVAEETAAEQEVVLEFTQKGYVRRLAPKAYERQQAKQESQATRKWVENSDFTTYADYVTTEDELLVLTRSGKAYTVKVGDIPPTTRQSKGTPVVGMLPASAQEDAEAIVEQLILTPGSEALDQLDLVMLTRQGKVKRTPLKEFVNLSGRGVMALKLKEGDELAFALLVEADFQLLLATSGGRILRLEINDEQLPLMSRSAQGLQLVRLGKQEEIIGCISLGTDDEMLLMTAQGYAKRMAVSAIRAISRGDLGVQGMAFATKADRLVGLVPAFPGDTIVVITDEDHLAYLSVDDVEVMDRNDGGDRPLKLSRKEKVTRLVTLALPSLGDETDESGNG